MSTASRPVKIVYVTDRGFLRPTLVSIWSLLSHLRGPAELHVWGTRLSGQDWQHVSEVCAAHRNVTLISKDLSTGYLDAAHSSQSHVTVTTMGRLFIPRLIDGYVLYIDGDTLVRGDVAPLFQFDLGDACAGVVRDYFVSRIMGGSSVGSAARDARLASIAAFMQPAPVTDYFNAGVLLLNCDRIKSDTDLLARVEDVEAASACELGDQDHLNMIFANNVAQLDLVWNASWARVRKHRGYLHKIGAPAAAVVGHSPVIVHYHGKQKPWQKPRLDVWSDHGRATLVYRRVLRGFVRKYPHLKPV